MQHVGGDSQLCATVQGILRLACMQQKTIAILVALLTKFAGMQHKTCRRCRPLGPGEDNSALRLSLSTGPFQDQQVML